MENILRVNEEFTNSDNFRYSTAQPPKEAYLYLPRGIEVIEFDENNPAKSLRRIFQGGVEYNSFEKAKIKDLKLELKKLMITMNNKKQTTSIIEEFNNMKEADMLRFLQAATFDITITCKNILNNLKWKRINSIGSHNFFSNVPENIIKILNSGLIYAHGRDSRFRPIIILVPSVYQKISKKFSFSEFEYAIIYLLEYLIRYALLPGQIENLNIICDLNSFSITSIADDFKKILNMVQNNYCCRLYVMYIKNMVNIGGWSIIKKFINQRSERKIRVLNSENMAELFAFINKKQVEKKYGGMAPNVYNYYFPPIFPSDTYLMEDENKNIILTDEDIYRNLIKSNKELIPSPYLNFKKDSNSEVKVDSNKYIIDYQNLNSNLTLNYPEVTTYNTDHINPQEMGRGKSDKEVNREFVSQQTLDQLKLIEIERKNVQSSQRITNKIFRKNEKVLNMQTLNKQVGSSPNKLSSKRQKYIRSSQNLPSKTKNTTSNFLDFKSPSQTKLNRSDNLGRNSMDISLNLTKDETPLLQQHRSGQDDHKIIEEKEQNKVCCTFHNKQCYLF